jgi:metallopeptidase MepB
MDKNTGLRYRQHVLQPGGSQPELKSLSNFLGREPNDEAYYSEVTITPGSETSKSSAL